MQTQNFYTRFLPTIILTLCALMPVRAQYNGPKIVAVTAVVKPPTVAAGGKAILLVMLTVSPQYHINAHKPNDPAYIPTVFTSVATHGITFGDARYPAPKPMKLSYAKTLLLVYTGKTTIAVPFTVAKTAKPGKTTLAGAVSFQGCDAKSCYPPASSQIRSVVTIK